MGYDPPDPRRIVRGIFGLALVAAASVLVVAFVTTGRVQWKLVALMLTLWAVWSFFSGLMDTLFVPLGRFLAGALGGGVVLSGPPISIEEETASLEHLLQGPLPPHREILAGIRLAEIYRTHQRVDAKADAVIDRLLAKYPDAPELRFVRRA